jgi:moderate conductance mechanosensitive channel
MKWLIVFFFISSCALASAQSVDEGDNLPPPIDKATRQKVDDLLQLIQDPALQQWIATRDQEASGSSLPPGSTRPEMSRLAGLAFEMKGWEENARDRVSALLSSIPRIPDEIEKALRKIKTDAISDGYAPLSFIFVLLIFLAVLAEWIFRRLVWKHWGGLEHYLPIIIFTAIVTVFYLSVPWPPLVRIVFGYYIIALVAYRFFASAIQHTSHSKSHTRLLKFGAGVLLSATATIAVGAIIGADVEVLRAYAILSSLLLLTVALAIAWRTANRRFTTKVVISIHLGVIWIFWCIDLRTYFWLGLYFITLPPLLRTVSPSLLGRFSDEFGFVASEARDMLFARASRALIIMIAFAWIAHVWRSDPGSFGRNLPQFGQLLDGILKSILVLILAELFWHLAKSAIERGLAPVGVHRLAGNADNSGFQTTRLQTLLPVLRTTLAVGLFAVTGLTILAQLGIDITPLVAGAGIFGVAIGFGSQALVRDVIGGIFYLFDDAFRVGEYIETKDYKGTVEGFNLRSVKLRHSRGPLTTVPFGELGAVQNMSRDWSKLKITVTLPFDVDLEKVRKIGKAVGQQLESDPEIGRYFVEPLKMKGVEEFGQYGVVVSFSLITIPTNQQSFIRRSAYAMLREVFHENGISFAQPTVQFGGGDASPSGDARKR